MPKQAYTANPKKGKQDKLSSDNFTETLNYDEDSINFQLEVGEDDQ